MQVIRDKLVLDLEPCFRYLDKDRKDCIRVVTPMVMLLEAVRCGLDELSWNWMIVFVVSGIVCLALLTGSEWGIQCSMLRIFTVVNLCLM